MLYLGLQLLSAVALLGILALTGETLGRFLPKAPTALGRFCDRVAAGSAIWMAILATMASLGFFLKPVLLAAASAATLLGMAVAFRSRKDQRASPIQADASDESPRTQQLAPAALLLTALGFVLAVMAVQALRPNISWDANVYHLTLPRTMLEQGGFVLQEMLVYAHWPLGVDLLFGLAMAVNTYITAKLLHFAFGVLTLVAAGRLAGVGGASSLAAVLAAGLILVNQVVQYEIRVAYVDLAYAFFLATSMLHLLRGLEPAGDDEEAHTATGIHRSHLLLAGVSAAAMVSCKLNGFFGLVALLAVATSILLTRRRSGGPSLIAGATLLCGPSVLAGAFWGTKSLILTGNPVYPLFHGLFGGADWSATLSAQHAAWQGTMGFGRTAADYVLLPFRVIFQGDFGYATFDGKSHWIWAVALPLAVWAAVKDRVSRSLLIATAALFVLWSLSSQQMRFLIPLFPLLAAASARGLDQIGHSIGRPRIVHFAFSTLVAGLLIHSSWIYIRQTQRLGGDLIRYGADIERAVVHPVYPWIDNNLPKDAKLLLLNTNHGFYVRRDYVADSFFEASQIADATKAMSTAQEVRSWMFARGVTHLLIEQRNRGITYSPGLIATIEESYVLYRSDDERFQVRALSLNPSRNAALHPARAFR